VLRSTEELFIAMVEVFLTFILNNSKSFHAATSGGFLFIVILSFVEQMRTVHLPACVSWARPVSTHDYGNMSSMNLDIY